MYIAYSVYSIQYIGRRDYKKYYQVSISVMRLINNNPIIHLINTIIIIKFLTSALQYHTVTVILYVVINMT